MFIVCNWVTMIPILIGLMGLTRTLLDYLLGWNSHPNPHGLWCMEKHFLKETMGYGQLWFQQ